MEDTNKLTKALLPIAMSMVTSEGITDEKESIERANAIVQDALLETPTTDAGKVARMQAYAALQNGVNLSGSQPVKFNYDNYRDETAIPAVCGIIKKMGELADYLAIPSHSSSEYEKKAEEAYEALSLATFAVLNEKNVGMQDYKFVFESLKSIISALENHIMQQVTGHRHEIMSRLLGAKNPGTAKFDANYGTYANVTSLLEKTREETGGKLSDYFNITDDSDKK